jgi:hypothetical protein
MCFDEDNKENRGLVHEKYGRLGGDNVSKGRGNVVFKC